MSGAKVVTDITIRYLDIAEVLPGDSIETVGHKLMTRAFRTFTLTPVTLSDGVTARFNSGLFRTQIDGHEVFAKAFAGDTDISGALLATRNAPELFPTVFGFGAVDALSGGNERKAVTEQEVQTLFQNEDKHGFLEMLPPAFRHSDDLRDFAWETSKSRGVIEITSAINRGQSAIEACLFAESDDEAASNSHEEYGSDEESGSDEDSGTERGSVTSEESDGEKDLVMDGDRFRTLYVFTEPVNCDYASRPVSLQHANELLKKAYAKGIVIGDTKRDNFCYNADNEAVYVDFGGVGTPRNDDTLELLYEDDFGLFFPRRAMTGGGSHYVSIGVLALVTFLMSFS